jgi:hypothetical protein
MKKKDCYDTLNLPQTATIEEVKKRYRQIALQNHPDKLSSLNLPNQDYDEKVNTFKRATAAYGCIIQNKFSYGGDFDPSKPFDFSDNLFDGTADMMDVFNDVLTDPSFNEFIENTFKSFFQDNTTYPPNPSSFPTYSPFFATECYQPQPIEHNVKVHISFLELHKKEIKKCRFFLKNCPKPIYYNVDCSEFPKTTIIHSLENGEQHILNLQMELLPFDDYRYIIRDDSTIDIYKTIKMNLKDLFVQKPISFLHFDNSQIFVETEQFDLKNIKLKNKGINGGNLFLTKKLKMPKRKQWYKFKDKNELIDLIEKLYI